MKICTACQTEKSEQDFYKDVRNKTGLHTHCKSCQKSKHKNYISKNRHISRRSNNAYYKKNKDTIKKNTKQYDQTLSGRLATYKRAAKTRGIVFGLTKEEFSSFWKKPCWYCGDEIQTIGLDRIDSSWGYSIENVVSCCTSCNTAKMRSSVEDFIHRCTRIARRHAERG